MNLWFQRVWQRSKSWVLAHPRMTAGVIAVAAGVTWWLFWPQWAPSALWTRFRDGIKDATAAVFACWVAIFFIQHAARFFRQRSAIQPTTVTAARLNPDRPIASAADDAFSLDNVAIQLASAVQLPAESPSVVLGLEGAWGCGKSSLLALVASKLEMAPTQPLVVRFNPWSVPNSDDLVAALLEAMGAALGIRRGRGALERELTGLREDLDRLAGAEPGSFRWWIASLFRRFFGVRSSLAVDQRKAGISAGITELGVPVIVIIDDVDRLQQADICNLFRLIHEVIDFQRVCYVLAYDPEPIHQALGASHEDLISGRRYKEKIVQLAFQFPRLSPLRLRKYASTLFLDGLRNQGIALSEAEKERWEEAVTICNLMLRTPRAIKQAANSIGITARLLLGEVCVSDIAVFEALYQRNPSLVQRLRNHPEILVQAHQLDVLISPVTMEVMGSTATGDAPKQALTTLLSLDMGEDALALTRGNAALKFLFPKAFKLNKGSKGRAALGQIDDPNNLLKLLCLGLQPGTLSGNAAREFIDLPGKRADILSTFTSALQIAEFLRHTAQFVRNIAVAESHRLIEDLLKCADVWFDSEGESLVDDVAAFIVVLINESALDAGERLALLEYVSCDAGRLSTGARVLIDAVKHLGLLKDGVWQVDRGGQSTATGAWAWLSSYDADKLRLKWIERFDAESWDSMVELEPDFVGLLYRRAQYDQNNYGLVQAKLHDLLVNSDEAARRFAMPYAGMWAVDGLEKLVPDIYWLHERLKTVHADPIAIEKIRDHFEAQIAAGPLDSQV